MLLAFATAILICILSVLLKWSLWRRKCSQQMPGKVPKLFDILGDTKDFAVYDSSPNKYFWQTNFFDVMRKRTKEFGKHQLFCLWFLFWPFIFIVRYRAVKEVIEKKITEKNFFYSWLEPVFGTGLLISKVSKWKPRRKLLMPCFHTDILRGFFPIFNKYSQKLLEFLEEETKKEFTYIETPISLLTLNIICETMFGVKANDNSERQSGKDCSEFVKSFTRFNQLYVVRFFKPWIWLDFFFQRSKDGKEMMHHSRKIHEFTRKVIQEKKKAYFSSQRDENNRKRKSLMDLLLDKQMEEELSEEDIMEEVKTFALAGFETVSLAIVWALYLIGLHSDVQAKLNEELDKVFGEDTTRTVSEKDLNDLQYLDCVLKETIRLYPPAPWFGRKSPEDSSTDICGHTIPKGTTLIILPYLIHRDEEVFPDPEKFDPERFSPENCHKIPEYAFIPFSVGPRNCIGQRFALLEKKIIISSILRKFTVESLDERDKVKPFIYITLHPSVPVRIRFRPRIFQKQH